MATSSLKNFSQLRPLWAMLTGGAFVSFSGGALILFYFLGIGGIPIGQAASFSSIAKVAVPMAIFLGISFLIIWLSPTLVSFTFIDYQSFSKILRHLFTTNLPPNNSIHLTTTNLHNTQDTWELVTERKASIFSENYLQTKSATTLPPYYSVNRQRVFFFSTLTVGMGCFAAIFYALHADKNTTEGWTHYAAWIALAGWVILLLAFLVIMWIISNNPSQIFICTFLKIIKKKNVEVQKNTKLPNSYLLIWIFFGFISSAISTTPLFYLVILFLKSDYLLATNSFTIFIFGTIAISTGIIFVYTLSLLTLIEKIQGKPAKWGLLLGLNATILGFMILMLGMSSRMLEAVMVMASVRVENAFITLEPEGCDLLQAMGANGWGYPSKNSKICVLHNVTIQSTLEPAMQIACWRGTIPKKIAQDDKSNAYERPNKASPSDPMEVSAEHGVATASTENPTHTAPPGTRTTEVTGLRGAFTIPVKHVRSVWKTSGALTSDDAALCATSMKYQGQ